VVTFQGPIGDLMDAPVIVEPEEQALLAPVTPGMTYALIHGLSQTPLRPPDAGQITAVRRTATIRPGTRMIKLLSARQLGAYLHGRRSAGFCYREFDLSLLRSSADLSLLLADSMTTDSQSSPVVYGLRWRAIDAADYHIPFSIEVGDMPAYRGLRDISPHDRLGPPVLGTGFAPSRRHLIPEFVTADMADLPMPAGTSLVAFGPDGEEISLYLYLPEQRAWTRMFGPQHRHLVSGVPELSVEQEYVQGHTDHTGGSTLFGWYRAEMYEAIADPPHDFQVLARVRAARYPVDSVHRRTRYVTWRNVACTVVRIDGDWWRLRMCRPDRDSASMLGAQCIERGVYEVWAPASEAGPGRDVDQPYAVAAESIRDLG
jgi:hypothetical protein